LKINQGTIRCLDYFFTVLFGLVAGSQWLPHDDDSEWQVALYLGQRRRVPGSLHGEYKRVCVCGCCVSVSTSEFVYVDVVYRCVWQGSVCGCCVSVRLARKWIDILRDCAGVAFGNDIMSHLCDISTPDDARMSDRLAALRGRETPSRQECANKKLS